jgi:hypothetical protein
MKKNILYTLIIISLTFNDLSALNLENQVIWDSVMMKEVVYHAESKAFKYADGNELGNYFIKQSLPTLNHLSKSDAGRRLIVRMQNLETKLVIDPTYAKDYKRDWKGSNSLILRSDERFPNGLYQSVYILPNYKNMEKYANENLIDLAEVVLAVITVEIGHIETKEQIELEIENEDKMYRKSEAFAAIYQVLLNDAVRANIAYRLEKRQPITKSAFFPVINLKDTIIGKKLYLDDDNQRSWEKYIK